MAETLCPRCGKGLHPSHNALSRLTEIGGTPIYVCSDCGVEEAIQQWNNNGVAVDWRKEK